MDSTHNLSLFNLFDKHKNEITINNPFRYETIQTNDPAKEKIINDTISREIYLLFCDFIEGYQKYYTKNMTLDLIFEFFYTLEKFKIKIEDNNFLDNLSLQILQYFRFEQQEINQKITDVKKNIVRFFVNIYLLINTLTQGTFPYFKYNIEDELTIKLEDIRYLAKLNEYFLPLLSEYGFPYNYKKDDYDRNIFDVDIKGSCRNIYFYNIVNDTNPFNNKPVLYYQPYFFQLIGEHHTYKLGSIDNIDKYLLLSFNTANIFYDPIVYSYEAFNVEFNEKAFYNIYTQPITNIKTSLLSYVVCDNKYGPTYPNNDNICKKNIYYMPDDYRLFTKYGQPIKFRNKMFQDIDFYPHMGDIINFYSISPESQDFSILCYLLMGHQENPALVNVIMNEQNITDTSLYYEDLYLKSHTLTTKTIPTGYFNVMRKYIFINNFKDNIRKYFYDSRYLYSLNDTFLYDMKTSNRNNYFKFTDFLNLINLQDSECKSRRYWSIVRDYLINKIDRTSEIGLTTNSLQKISTSVTNPMVDEIFFNYVDYRFGFYFYSLIIHNSYNKKDDTIYRLSDSVCDLFLNNPLIFDRFITFIINLFDDKSYMYKFYYLFKTYWFYELSIAGHNSLRIDYRVIQNIFVTENLFILDIDFIARNFLKSKSMNAINPNFLSINEKNIIYMGDAHTTNIFYFIINYLSDLLVIKNFYINKEFFGDYVDASTNLEQTQYLNLKKEYENFFDTFHLYKYDNEVDKMDNFFRSCIYKTIYTLTKKNINDNVIQTQAITPLINNNYNFTNENVFNYLNNQKEIDYKNNLQAFNNYYIYFIVSFYSFLNDYVEKQFQIKPIEFIKKFLNYPNDNTQLSFTVYEDILDNLKNTLKSVYKDYYLQLNIMNSNIAYSVNVSGDNPTIIINWKQSYQYQFFTNKKLSPTFLNNFNQLPSEMKVLVENYCICFLRSNIYYDPRYYNMKLINALGNKLSILYDNENYLSNLNFLIEAQFEYNIVPNDPFGNKLFYTDAEKQFITS